MNGSVTNVDSSRCGNRRRPERLCFQPPGSPFISDRAQMVTGSYTFCIHEARRQDFVTLFASGSRLRSVRN